MRATGGSLEDFIGRPIRDVAGAGAAGGLGAGLIAFLDARLRPGAELILEAVGFASEFARADLVVTGEGRFDEQSAGGKVVGAVVRAARAAGVPVIVVAGGTGAAPTTLDALGPAAVEVAAAPGALAGAADVEDAAARATLHMRDAGGIASVARVDRPR